MKRAVTPATVGAEILGARVDVNGEGAAGHVTGVLAHPANGAIGLEVTSPDHTRRFLPLVAATLTADGVVDVPSSLLLVESCDAYIERGATLCRDVTSVDELESSHADELESSVRGGVSDVLVAGMRHA